LVLLDSAKNGEGAAAPAGSGGVPDPSEIPF